MAMLCIIVRVLGAQYCLLLGPAWIPVCLEHLCASRNIRSVECEAAASSVTILCCLCAATTKRIKETPKDFSWLLRKQMVRLGERGRMNGGTKEMELNWRQVCRKLE